MQNANYSGGEVTREFLAALDAEPTVRKKTLTRDDFIRGIRAIKLDGLKLKSDWISQAWVRSVKKQDVFEWDQIYPAIMDVYILFSVLWLRFSLALIWIFISLVNLKTNNFRSSAACRRRF